MVEILIFAPVLSVLSWRRPGSPLPTPLAGLKNVCLGTSVESEAYLDRVDELRKVRAAVRFIPFEPLLGLVAQANLKGIHWVIVGGESGPRSRPMREEWAGEIETACRKARTAFFFKQWGRVRKKSTVEAIAAARSTRCRGLRRSSRLACSTVMETKHRS